MFTKPTTFKLTLTDPCDPPANVTPSTIMDQTYTVTSSPIDFTPTAFTVMPNYCKLDYTISATTTPGGNNCIAKKDSEQTEDSTITIGCNNLNLEPAGKC